MKTIDQPLTTRRESRHNFQTRASAALAIMLGGGVLAACGSSEASGEISKPVAVSEAEPGETTPDTQPTPAPKPDSQPPAQPEIKPVIGDDSRPTYELDDEALARLVEEGVDGMSEQLNGANRREGVFMALLFSQSIEEQRNNPNFWHYPPYLVDGNMAGYYETQTDGAVYGGTVNDRLNMVATIESESKDSVALNAVGLLDAHLSAAIQAPYLDPTEHNDPEAINVTPENVAEYRQQPIDAVMNSELFSDQSGPIKDFFEEWIDHNLKASTSAVSGVNGDKLTGDTEEYPNLYMPDFYDSVQHSVNPDTGHQQFAVTMSFHRDIGDNKDSNSWHSFEVVMEKKLYTDEDDGDDYQQKADQWTIVHSEEVEPIVPDDAK